MACLSDTAFKMPSLLPQDICLTAWHCLRAEYLFTPLARLGGAKGTVSCGSSPGSPWKRSLSFPPSSGLVVASGRRKLLLMQWGFLSPDKAPVVNTWNKRGIHNSSKQVICARVKKKIWKQFYFFLQIQWKLFPGILLSKWCVTTPSCCYFCYFWQQHNSYCSKGMLRLLFLF